MQLHLDINATLEQLLAQEDTDGDKRITVEDKGPKLFLLKGKGSDDVISIEGTYYLSNLLQELILAKEAQIETIDTNSIFEKPVDRLKRMIETYYWSGLTRTIDRKGLSEVLTDEKSESEIQRIYVPHNDDQAYSYYQNLRSEFSNLEVIKLPKTITPEYVSSINDKPGILSLKLIDKNDEITGVPFVVPGGRFNEMYGWDSYFESVGLLLGTKSKLAKNMADNFQYEIEYYGKILNANRTYYLTRTQPPFYTSLIREVFENRVEGCDKDWLLSQIKTAIKEYETVWMVQDKRLTANGLNRYLAEGIGLPPEVEEGHYDALLKPHATKAGISVNDYERDYYLRQIKNEALDHYFIHDRSVRENGHDTSYRLEGRCAQLNCAELNTFLYQYEQDFAYLIQTYFAGSLTYDGQSYDETFWLEKAEKRKELIQEYLWNEVDHCYYDYDIESKCQIPFVSATSLIPLWAKIPTQEQAEQLVENILPKLLFFRWRSRLYRSGQG